MSIRSNPQAHNATTIESRLRTRWAELLGMNTEEISMHSDFLSLGGNSMLLLSLHVFVTQEFNVSLLVPDLIQNAIFSQMLELLQNGISTDI